MLDLSTWTDISSHQNAYQPHIGQEGKDIIWQKMVDQGVTGVCIRKSLGRFHDAYFERNWQGAGDVGLKRTVYCVPFVSYDMAPQQEAMSTWPSGGMFGSPVDIPAWDDVERKHKLTRRQAISRLLPYHYAMQDTFGAVEFYTAKYVWQDFYSLKPGWQKDWGLVVAFYRPDLYHLPIEQLKNMVAAQEIHPKCPIGWAFTSSGMAIPNDLQWEEWQISADGNQLGPQYGTHRRDLDISFRQGKLPPVPPPDDGTLKDLVVVLRDAWGELVDDTELMGDILTKVEEEVNA